MSLVAADQRTTRWAWAFVVLLTLVAAVLRAWSIHESLWVDELHTAWCADGALSEVAERATIGNQSPLFFWLEWLLIRVFGSSEFSLRLLSLLAGSLLPLATFWIARRWNATSVGLLAALLVTIDPLTLFYAGEARPYALVQLLSVIHLAILLELIVQPSTRLRVAWIVTAALLFHLHYTAALLFPEEIAFLALVSFVKPHTVQHKLSAFSLDWLAVAASCLPAVGNLLAIFGRRTNWTFVEQDPLWVLFDWWPTALGFGFVMAALALSRITPTATDEPEQRTDGSWLLSAILVCWLLIPASIAWGATAADFTRLFFPRYLLSIAPAAALLAACCVRLAPWWWARVAIGIWVVAAAFCLSNIGEEFRDHRRIVESRGEDWRGSVTWLNEQLENEPFPVLVWSGLIEANALREPHDDLLEDYLLLPVTSLYPIAADRGDLFPLPLDEPGQLPQAAEMLAVHRGGAWLVVRGDRELGQRIAQSVAAHLDEANAAGTDTRWHTGEPQSFGKVQLLRLTTASAGNHPSPKPATDSR